MSFLRFVGRIQWLLLGSLMLVTTSRARARGGDPSLTVVTYNIHHGVGVDGVLSLERIAQQLEETGAEVIALQEVDKHWGSRSAFADQAKELATLLGMHYAYGANLDLPPGQEGEPRRQYGTAILSAYPIRTWSNTLLPNLGGEQRGLLETVIQVRGVPVHVLNTHLQHNNGAERAAQAAAIAAHIEQITEPVVLLGDLNATPGAHELRALEMQLDDAWRIAGAGDGYTIPVEAPNRRIDYVFVSRCVAVTDATVSPTLASDHLPVAADLSLPNLLAWRFQRTCKPAALSRAHAHNDYEHQRPLLDALDHGFASVEADVWLVDGQLLVAHDFEDLDPARTFEALYLAPLEARIHAQRGRVHAGWPHSLQLLIDIKTEGESTYRAVHEALARHRGMFTTFVHGKAYESAVTAVISGNRPRELMASQTVRYAGYDGRLADLGVSTDESFMPLVSDRWTSVFTWHGEGDMPAQERARLREIVATAHANGQRVRFWATPETGPREAVWAELVSAGVDYINTDDLTGLRHWLLRNEDAPSKPALDWFDAWDDLYEWLPWLVAR